MLQKLKYLFSKNTFLWIKSNNVKGACTEKLTIKNSCLDLIKEIVNTIIFRQNMQGFRTSLKKTEISPLYTYNKNETKSKQIQQARIIWTVVHL